MNCFSSTADADYHNSDGMVRDRTPAPYPLPRLNLHSAPLTGT
ncbi:MAG TPA: hypothetical protein V6D33_09795 [Cyanophyceae cyanobacterium]